MICGFGGLGYRLAVNAVARLLGGSGDDGLLDSSRVIAPAADSVPRPEGWA
jgi:hypothetical protein